MSTVSLTLDRELLGTTAMAVAKEARDLNYVDTPFLKEQERLLGKGAPNYQGGFRMIQAMMVSEHSEGTAQLTGYEEIDLDVTTVIDEAVLTPASVVTPVLYSLWDKDLQGGSQTKIIDLVAQRVRAAVGAAKRRLERQIMRGAQNRYTAFYTLNGSDVTTGNVGFLEPDAVGSQTNVIGGFSKATYASLPGAQNQIYDAAGSAQTGLITGLARISIKTKGRTDEEAKWCWLLSELGLENYKRITGGSEQYVVVGKEGTPDGIDAVSMNLFINGHRAVPSTFMPNSGTVTGSNSDEWSAVLIDFNAIHFTYLKGAGVRDGNFGVRPFVPVGGNYDTEVMKIDTIGQLEVEGFGSSGILIGADVFA